MVAAAKEAAADCGYGSSVEFRADSVASALKGAEAAGAGYDVVYSNAVLHWVDNHEVVFPALMRHLVNRGGVLAVQMPDTRAQLSHTMMRDAARKCGFEAEVKHVRIPSAMKEPSYYYRALYGSYSDIDLWTSEYLQQLPWVHGADNPVLDYVRATGLVPVLDALGGEKSEKAHKFLDLYHKLLTDVYYSQNITPEQAGIGHGVLFPFKRFFMVARRGNSWQDQ
jgi:trans-aconitate 2-methyltransferase